MFNFENKRKMKKIVLVCIVAIMATAAQAQIYVGGTLGFSSVKTENSDAELKTTTIKLLPEIGYELWMRIGRLVQLWGISIAKRAI